MTARRFSVTLLFAFAVAACSGSSHGGSSYGSGDPSLAAPNPAGGPIDPFLTNGQAVLRALDAVAARSGTPLRVTQISADGVNGLMLDVQEPKRHMNVDHYVVAADGNIAGPTPVKLMSLDGGPITAASVDARAFDPKAIAFAALTATVREAIKRSNYADARVAQWEIDGLGPDDRRYIYLESARARPTAAVTPGLKVVRMSF
ncbi:MAG: hypothetical protein JO190_07470 [Candidatus Eremiobacteraeota bacterium]|nr:hypothetical protein [Candidatus Eremiobacteraeota bacterium]MBV8497778.1 hypothetical protein [Candidatus Eremiobacteraeota bacterium]